MKPNGIKIPKRAFCRICKRFRPTEKYLKAVGEHHSKYGFPRYIFECDDHAACAEAVRYKLSCDEFSDEVKLEIRKAAMEGHYTKYRIIKE